MKKFNFACLILLAVPVALAEPIGLSTAESEAFVQAERISQDYGHDAYYQQGVPVEQLTPQHFGTAQGDAYHVSSARRFPAGSGNTEADISFHQQAYLGEQPTYNGVQYDTNGFPVGMDQDMEGQDMDEPWDEDGERVIGPRTLLVGVFVCAIAGAMLGYVAGGSSGTFTVAIWQMLGKPHVLEEWAKQYESFVPEKTQTMQCFVTTEQVLAAAKDCSGPMQVMKDGERAGETRWFKVIALSESPFDIVLAAFDTQYAMENDELPQCGGGLRISDIIDIVVRTPTMFTIKYVESTEKDPDDVQVMSLTFRSLGRSMVSWATAVFHACELVRQLAAQQERNMARPATKKSKRTEQERVKHSEYEACVI